MKSGKRSLKKLELLSAALLPFFRVLQTSCVHQYSMNEQVVNFTFDVCAFKLLLIFCYKKSGIHVRILFLQSQVPCLQSS